MAGLPPSPLIAAVGLVATAADGLRRLPHALGSAGHAALRRYDELAVRGQHVLAGSPGEAATAGLSDIKDTDEIQDILVETYEEVPPVSVVAPEPPIGLTEPVVLPEDVQEEVAQLTPGAELGHDELPLPDFDHQTVPQLRGRLRTLELAELVQLRDYEQAHGARMPVLTLLDNRIAKLLADSAE